MDKKKTLYTPCIVSCIHLIDTMFPFILLYSKLSLGMTHRWAFSLEGAS